MTPRPASARSGITLTEILIAILIMGVGLISLATLFPIGLVRLRQAQQQSRSGLLGESAIGDMGSKNLLSKPTFFETYYGNFDPFLVDALPGGPITLTTVNPVNLNAANGNNYNFTGGGLPICYDPLWRSVTGVGPGFQAGTQLGAGSFPNGSFSGGFAEARFGAGIVGGNSFVRADPQGGAASAYGLQRITNFVPWCPITSGWALTYPNPLGGNPTSLRDYAAETFVSPEDIVMQNSEPNQQILNNPNPSDTTGQAASVVPMFFPTLNGAGVQVGSEIRSDYRYTWLFTGRQIDTSNGTQFDGDIVVMENRPFALDPVVSPVSGNPSNVAAGEIVLEAIFGYGFATATTPGYAVAGDRTVLVRWPTSMPDPEFKVGSWIADVTYERNQAISDTRANNTLSATGTGYPFQRCHWYQVAKKSDATPDVTVPNYRQMTIYTTTPLKARTLLSAGNAVNLNVALFMPSVVNVFQKTFYVR